MAEHHADVSARSALPGEIGLPHLAGLRIDDHRAAKRLIAAVRLPHERGPGALAILDGPSPLTLVDGGAARAPAASGPAPGAIADLHPGKAESLPVAVLHQLDDEGRHVDVARDQPAADIEARAFVG